MVVAEERDTGGKSFTSDRNKGGPLHSAWNTMGGQQIFLQWINGVSKTRTKTAESKEAGNGLMKSYERGDQE